VNEFLDPRVNAVVSRLDATRAYPQDGVADWRYEDRDPAAYAQYGFSVSIEQGTLMYLLCRATRATRVVEFATSVGLSLLHFASAVRDNGGGMVIGSELVPEKVAAARRNVAEAGLTQFVDIREGDARETLRDCGGPIDFVLIDGWPRGRPTLARQVIEIVAPQIRIGGLVMNDNHEEDYLEYVRSSGNGFLSVSLPLSMPHKRPTELSVKLA
jgi:predicted O-methyltransferase YrrM